jgi:hypothetical protein
LFEHDHFRKPRTLFGIMLLAGAISISARVLEPPPAGVHRASGAARVHIRDNVNRNAPPSAEMPAALLRPQARA